MKKFLSKVLVLSMLLTIGLSYLAKSAVIAYEIYNECTDNEVNINYQIERRR